ncbi:hypothetical protein Q7P37_007296 [Cladosporium fusiforme]
MLSKRVESPSAGIAITPCADHGGENSTFTCGLDNAGCRNKDKVWTLGGLAAIALRPSQIAELAPTRPAMESSIMDSQTTTSSVPTTNGTTMYTAGQMAGLGCGLGLPLTFFLVVALCMLHKEKQKHTGPKLMYKLPDNHQEFISQLPNRPNNTMLRAHSNYSIDSRPGVYSSHGLERENSVLTLDSSRPAQEHSFLDRYNSIKSNIDANRASRIIVHEMDGVSPHEPVACNAFYNTMQLSRFTTIAPHTSAECDDTRAAYSRINSWCVYGGIARQVPQHVCHARAPSTTDIFLRTMAIVRRHRVDQSHNVASLFLSLRPAVFYQRMLLALAHPLSRRRTFMAPLSRHDASRSQGALELHQRWQCIEHYSLMHLFRGIMPDLAFSVLWLSSIAFALPLNTPLLAEYDYIVVGGGPSGLTVANRLSEDPHVDVLVLEAGPADVGEDIIYIPGFIGHNIGGQYDWNLSTVPQAYMDGNPRSIPQGRALGGGTLLNGMLWNRGGRADYDDWVQLGNPGWSWDDLLPYFKKSESYSPVQSPDVAEEYSTREDRSVHGYSGPVNVSFPRYTWNASINLFDGLNELGIPTAYDPNAGDIAGASYLPFDLEPVTQTRNTARRAYFDSVVDRPNLWVATGQTVTQLLFNGAQGNLAASTPVNMELSLGQGTSPGAAGGIFGNGSVLNINSLPPDPPSRGGHQKRSFIELAWVKVKRAFARFKRQTAAQPSPDLTATGVEFAADAHSERQTIRASREVILAAGAIHTPQLLMLSGIGPSQQLQHFDIHALVDLPGVGSNLQDHMQVWCWFPYHNPYTVSPTALTTDQAFVNASWTDYWTSRTGPFTSGAITGVAFPSLPSISNESSIIADLAKSQAPAMYLPDDSDQRVLAGYSAQLSLLSAALNDRKRAVFELINANDGDLTVATMRPLSRGTLSLASSQPFTPPLIDPRYGSNPVDIQVLQAAIAFNERLVATESMAPLAPEQLYPPANASSEDIAEYIRSKGQTEYHPSGTAAMLPLELGGVVDPDLLVYGTRNLRIVDASIFPLVPAAHLQAVVYGVAEKAADIIKAANSGSSDDSQGSESVVSPPLLSLGPSPTTTPDPSPVDVTVVTMTTFVTVYV